jgi:uncharacterized protein GlcG (DUF336 family)
MSIDYAGPAWAPLRSNYAKWSRRAQSSATALPCTGIGIGKHSILLPQLTCFPLGPRYNRVHWRAPRDRWSPWFDDVEDDMPLSYESLTLEEAKQMLSAAAVKAASLGVAYNVAVVDAGGHLLAFQRQDGALVGSIDLAIDKAVTARIFDKTTSDLARLAQPGQPLFGIQESNAGKVIIFGGGIPVTLGGSIVGAVGASAGTIEQDIAVAEAAVAALGGPAQSSSRSFSGRETEQSAE